MNKFFLLSVIPLAATATIGSVMMPSAPAQALSVGIVNIAPPTGSSFTTNLTSNSAIDDTITFNGPGNITDSSISGITDNAFVNIANLLLSQSYAGFGTYSSNLATPFLSFDNGINFVVTKPLNVETRFFGRKGSIAVEFDGIFVDTINNTQIKGFGLLTGQIGNRNSYSITVESVPEPLTILGSGLALGFGCLFKSKKQSVKA